MVRVTPKLIVLLLALVLTAPVSADSLAEARREIEEARRLGWLYNWPAAHPHFENAERLFKEQGDARNAMLAHVGRLRGEWETLSFPEVSAYLAELLQDPLVKNDPELRLAALLPDDAQAADEAAARLRLSNAQRERLVAALGGEHRIVSWLSPKEARQRIYHLGGRAFADRVKLAWAGAAKGSSAPQWRALLALAQTWTRPDFPLSGEEVMAAGVPKGPLVGQVMREVEDWWVDSDFIDDKLSIVERLKAVAQGLAY